GPGRCRRARRLPRSDRRARGPRRGAVRRGGGDVRRRRGRASRRVPAHVGVGRARRGGHQPRGPPPAGAPRGHPPRRRARRVAPPAGVGRAAGGVAPGRAAPLGPDCAYATVDDVTDDIATWAPAYAGVDAAAVRRARDGVVVAVTEPGEPAGPPLHVWDREAT